MATNVFELYAKLGLDSTSFNKGLSTAKGSMSSFGGLVAGGFKKVMQVGAVAIGAATSAVGAFAVSAIRTGKEFDSSMAQVGATLGKSTSQMEEEIGSVQTAYGKFEGTLRDFARFMGANTKFTATEAAQALNYMALAGYDAQTSMEMLPNVLNLAAAGNMDLARASDMVTDTQTAFGISLERTSLMVDEMAKAASTGNTNVEQLGEAFLRVGGLARELNGGFVTLSTGEHVAVDGLQELEIAFTAMANAGVKGSEAGTHMRNMLLKLSSPTKDGAEALERLGVDVFDKVSGNMRSLSDIFGELNTQLGQMSQGDKLQVISDLFNTRDMASAEALLAAVEQDWDRIGESILDAKVPLDLTVQSIKETTDAFDHYKENGEGGLRDIAATARAALGTFGNDIDKATEAVAENFNLSLSDARQAVVAVDSAMKQAKGSATEMANTQLNNLNGDITKFTSALSDAKIELADQVIPTLREFVQLGTSGVGQIVRGFQTGGLEGAMSAFGGVLTKLLDKVIETTPEVIKAGGALLHALGVGIMNNMDKVISAGVEIINYLVDSMANGGLESFVDGALQIITALGSALLQQAPALMKMAIELAVQLVQYLAEGLNANPGGLFSFITTLGNLLLANMPALLTATTEIVNGLINGLVQALPAAIPVISGLLLQIGQMLVQEAPVLLTAALDIMMQLAQGFISALPSIVPQIVSLVVGICQFITDNASMVMDVAVQIILALASGLESAIPDLIPAVVDAVIAICMALTEPSSLMQLMTGAVTLAMAILEGLIRAIPQIVEAIPQLVANIVGALTAAVPELLAAAVLLFNALITGITEVNGELITLIPGLIAGLYDGFMKGVDAIKECGKQLIEGLWKGITERWEGFVTDMKGLGTGLVTTVKDMFGIHSPSTVFEGMGDNIVAGLSLGISSNDAEAIAQMTQLAESMGTAFDSINDKIRGTIANVMQGVIAFGKTLYNSLDGTSKAILSSIAKSLSQLVTEMIRGATNAIDGFMNVWKTIVAKVQGVLTEVIGKVTGFITDLATKAVEAAKGFAEALEKGLQDLPEKFSTIGTNIVNGIWTGLQEGWTWLAENVSKLATDLLDGAKNALGIKSPSKEFMYVGRMIDEGLAKGIDDYVGLVEKAKGNIESAVEITPAVGVSEGISRINNVTMNIYPSAGMDEKALAREINYRLAEQTTRKYAARRPVYA